MRLVNRVDRYSQREQGPARPRHGAGVGLGTLVEMTKSLGVQSEPVELDICRKEERGQAGFILRGDGFCSPAANGRNSSPASGAERKNSRLKGNRARSAATLRFASFQKKARGHFQTDAGSAQLPSPQDPTDSPSLVLISQNDGRSRTWGFSS